MLLPSPRATGKLVTEYLAHVPNLLFYAGIKLHVLRPFYPGTSITCEEKWYARSHSIGR